MQRAVQLDSYAVVVHSAIQLHSIFRRKIVFFSVSVPVSLDSEVA